MHSCGGREKNVRVANRFSVAAQFSIDLRGLDDDVVGQWHDIVRGAKAIEIGSLTSCILRQKSAQYLVPRDNRQRQMLGGLLNSDWLRP
jgi:hypothetical protein